MFPPPAFLIVLRGYDPASVDRVVGLVRAALLEPAGGDRREAAAAAVAAPVFPVRLRGYDRRQVDAFVVEARTRLL